MPGKPRNHRPATYISLPTDFSNNLKVRAIVRKFGNDGFNFCIQMCLLLASEKGFEYEATKESYEDMADTFGYEYKEFKNMMDYAIQEKKLFQTYKFDNGKCYIRCQYLEDVMLDKLISMRNRKKNHATKTRNKNE